MALGLRFDDWVSEVDPSSVILSAFRCDDIKSLMEQEATVVAGDFCRRECQWGWFVLDAQ